MEEKVKELETKIHDLEEKIHEITEFQVEQQKINETILKILRSQQPKFS